MCHLTCVGCPINGHLASCLARNFTTTEYRCIYFMDQKSAIKVSTGFLYQCTKRLDKCTRLILLIMFTRCFKHDISWTLRVGKRIIHISWGVQ